MCVQARVCVHLTNVDKFIKIAAYVKYITFVKRALMACTSVFSNAFVKPLISLICHLHFALYISSRSNGDHIFYVFGSLKCQILCFVLVRPSINIWMTLALPPWPGNIGKSFNLFSCVQRAVSLWRERERSQEWLFPTSAESFENPLGCLFLWSWWEFFVLSSALCAALKVNSWGTKGRWKLIPGPYTNLHGCRIQRPSLWVQNSQSTFFKDPYG